MDKKKILHVLPNNKKGGVTLRTDNISSYLDKRGYENSFLVPKGKGDFFMDDQNSRHKVYQAPYFLPKRFDTFGNIATNIYWIILFPYTLWVMRNIMKRESPDIVHVNGILMLQPAIAAWFENANIIWHLVSDLYPHWLIKLLMPLVKNVSDGIILATESNLQYYKLEDTNTLPIKLIPGVIDDDFFDTKNINEGDIRRELSISHNDIIITSVANISPIKGLEYAFEGLAQIEGSFSYLVVGEARDEEYKNKLDMLAKQLSIQDKTHMLGFRDDIQQILQDTDIFLLPSLGEGTPISIMEAMSVGCPIVATKVGGIPNMLECGKAGILVEPKDPKAIRDAISKYIEHPDLRNRHSTAGKELVEENFTIDVVGEKHIEIYEYVLQIDT